MAAGTGVIAITPRETGQVPPPNGGVRGGVALGPGDGEGLAVLPMYGNKEGTATLAVDPSSGRRLLSSPPTVRVVLRGGARQEGTRCESGTAPQR
ncbi:hypothetical protein GCM10025792_50230 [Pseudonocardia tropica]